MVREMFTICLRDSLPRGISEPKGLSWSSSVLEAENTNTSVEPDAYS